MRRRISGKRYFPEEIISELRECAVYLAEGVSISVIGFSLRIFTIPANEKLINNNGMNLVGGNSNIRMDVCLGINV